MRRYWTYAMKSCSLPHFQELPAVAELTASGHAEGAVFLPGFEAVTGGGHPPARLLGLRGARCAAAANVCLRQHLELWLGADHRLPRGMFQQVRRRLESQVMLPGGWTAPPTTLYKSWEHDNRQGKFIANAARTYEFYGHDWVFPLSDREFRNFYAVSGEGARWERGLYIRTVGRRLLTGDLARLGEIPLENGQTIMERPPARPSRRERWLSCADHVAREAVCLVGLAVVAQRAKRRLVPRTQDLLGFMHWFAGGADPRHVRARDVFEKYGVREALPPALWSILECHGSRSAAACTCNGLLAAVTLAREASRQW
jgi:hypothetical protein